MYDKNYELNTPVYPGQVVYTNLKLGGSYLRTKDAPYPVEVVFIGLNKEGGFFNIRYLNDKRNGMRECSFSELGTFIFYTKEDAIIYKENEQKEEMER